MSDTTPTGPAESPIVEVKVYRHDQLIHTQLCESADEATALVASWEETPGTECTVEDLSATTHDESSLEVGGTGLEGGYPNIAEADERP